MLGKGVTVKDCLVALAIIAVLGGLLGAILGWSGNQFGLSGGLRVLIIVAFASVSGGIARAVVARRVKARSALPRGQA